MTKFYALLKVPAQETKLKISPARKGVRMEFDGKHVFLTEHMALQIANALADCLEESQRGQANV